MSVERRICGAVTPVLMGRTGVGAEPSSFAGWLATAAAGRAREENRMLATKIRFMKNLL
jgi:hypothetical protein